MKLTKILAIVSVSVFSFWSCTKELEMPQAEQIEIAFQFAYNPNSADTKSSEQLPPCLSYEDIVKNIGNYRAYILLDMNQHFSNPIALADYIPLNLYVSNNKLYTESIALKKPSNSNYILNQVLIANKNASDFSDVFYLTYYEGELDLIQPRNPNAILEKKTILPKSIGGENADWNIENLGMKLISLSLYCVDIY